MLIRNSKYYIFVSLKEFFVILNITSEENNVSLDINIKDSTTWGL